MPHKKHNYTNNTSYCLSESKNNLSKNSPGKFNDSDIFLKYKDKCCNLSEIKCIETDFDSIMNISNASNNNYKK